MLASDPNDSNTMIILMGDKVHRMRNNVGYPNKNTNMTGVDTARNSWDLAITPADGDFLSVKDMGFMDPRQPDGSMPAVDFMKLSATSALIDKGVDVGLPYAGAAPDLGCFETGLPSGGSGGGDTGSGGSGGGGTNSGGTSGGGPPGSGVGGAAAGRGGKPGGGVGGAAAGRGANDGGSGASAAGSGPAAGGEAVTADAGGTGPSRAGTGGTAPGAASNAANSSGDSSGCGCRAAAHDADPYGPPFAALAALLLGLIRRTNRVSRVLAR
jgi:MYXO-CTERM domain-containing protein